MADIALSTRATTNREIDLVKAPAHPDQSTYPAAEAITAGAPVRLDTSTGRWTNANATSGAEAAGVHIASRTVGAGENVTAYRRGWVDGYVLDALAYGALVYLSNTDGRLADAAGTTSLVVGRVVPGHATTLGTAPDKLLDIIL